MTDQTPATAAAATPATDLSPERFAEQARAIEAEVGQYIVGQEQLVRQTLISLIAGSHALLEGVPGLGKTMLVRTMAEALELGFSRIQFTPDLMPADIVGTNIIVEEGGERRFRFQQGPIFANLVLADEINRATPKTQSALLEAMQEHRVTVAKQQYTLSEPFFVLATQNPLEMEGTYPLPEAQLDRFFFKVDVPFPTEDELVRIMERTTGGAAPTVGKAATGADILEMQRLARDVPIASHVMAYAIRLLRATHPETERVPEIVKAYVRYGASPRGAQAMVLGAKIHAHARRALQRGVRRRPGGRAARAATPDHPQLRGRGRGHQHRLDRARHHRRDAHRTGRIGRGSAWSYIRIYDRL